MGLIMCREPLDNTLTQMFVVDHFFQTRNELISKIWEGTPMSETIKYTCSYCGKEHEEWPALVYISPTNYNTLSEDDKKNSGRLDADFCVITHSDQTDKFIRCTLTQKVINHCENLEYGLWVSLSDKSYQDYSDNFNSENYETKYFGWLCNDLPGYDFNKGSIPTTVFTRSGNKRPEIVPHQDFDHPFVKDYYNGITKTEAEMRIKEMLKIVKGRDSEKTTTKPLWKSW